MFIPYTSDYCAESRPWLAYLTFPAIVAAAFDLAVQENMPDIRRILFLYIFDISGIDFLVYMIGTFFVLWTLGKAICAKIGNVLYVVSLFLSGGLGIGITAVFGMDAMWLLNWLVHCLAGMFLVFYPLNTVEYAIVIPPFRTFSVSGYWAVIMWFGADAVFCIGLGWLIPLFVHPLSFILGSVWATVLIRVHGVPEGPGDRTLWQWIKGEDPEGETAWKDSWSHKKQKKLKHHGDKLEQKLHEMDKECLVKEYLDRPDSGVGTLCQCGTIVYVPASAEDSEVECAECHCRVRIPGQNTIPPERHN